MSGGFPFYGKLETEPESAAKKFQPDGGALVEESLMTQFNAKVGDTLRLGRLTTRIVGSLKKVPGETVAFASIAARGCTISMDGLQKGRIAAARKPGAVQDLFSIPAGRGRRKAG